ncbi:MAG: hypothetical protein QF464_03350 [Myxococcota bacterium]|jgi:polysaccharide pyruvyl transferase WcaK-like protein|nr:hypothetical protein [Myxococcota bacterium]
MHPLIRAAQKAATTAAQKAVEVAAPALKDALDADRLLQRTTAGLIEFAARRYALEAPAPWAPGQPLKLTLVGYAGTRNTGADVRVEEMIRQFRHLFGDEHVDLSIFTMDPELTRGYFRTVKQVKFPDVFPKFLFDHVHTQHGVITCEGSMFKSKFANALSTLMVGALGLASAENKLAIGYGGEAGKMDPPLQALVRRYCADAFIIARNEASVEVLGDLGVSAVSGTDTAWTFDPAAPEVGAKLLREAGWDGQTPILAICPINPFWWPVRADLGKRLTHLATGAHAQEHYKSVYFHHGGAEVKAAQTAYLTAIANAVRALRQEREFFPILVGMEQLDRKACEELAPLMGGDPPLFISDEHDMYTMVSVTRQAHAMVSSRYHGIVTTMPGGVVSAGITMDERIRNLMIDRGTPELALEVDDPELEAKLLPTLRRLFDEADTLRDGIERCVVENLVRMGEMGMALVDHVRSHHPDFPFADDLGAHGDPWGHLPDFPEAVADLVARQRDHAA